MPHLKDMEELLFTVTDSNTRDYMKESMACYMASAYRASVVLSAIALFDDLLKKLGELGRVNAKAKTIFDVSSKKRDNQEVFESYLIDQLKSNSLLPGLDADFLEKLRWFRNKAAHPSGHHSSAEEARYVFAEVINRFLAKPILSTTQLADEVLASLPTSNFFPSTSLPEIKKVVEVSLSNLHYEVYPYLICKLLERVLDKEKEFRVNSKYFLSGMACIDDPNINKAIRKYVIEKKSSDKKYLNVVLILLGSNGKLFSDLDDITYQRLKVFIKERIETIDPDVAASAASHPGILFMELFENCPAELVFEKLHNEFDKFLEKFPFSAVALKRIAKHPLPFDLIIRNLIRRASASDVEIANEFIENIDLIEQFLVSLMKPVDAFKMLVGVILAAKCGADLSIDARNSHFSSSPKLRAKANKYLTEDSDAAMKILEEIVGKAEDVGNLLKYFVNK